MWLAFFSPLIQRPNQKNHPVPLLFVSLVCSAFITCLHSPLVSKSRNICLTRTPGPVKRQIPPEGSKSIKCAPAYARTRIKLADSGKVSGGTSEQKTVRGKPRAAFSGEGATPSKREKQETKGVLKKNKAFGRLGLM